MKEVNIYRPELDYSANESYKSLRTNLLFCGEEKKVIAVTSCTPNEGKSTVSLNLALSLAESVLVGRTEVDGEVKGLSHLLSHQETIENVIYSTNIPRFHIIYAGKVPPNPAELLGGEYFKRVLTAVKKVYDYVIVDTPPLGSVIDSAVIADECDGSIMVMESGAISYRFAQEVKEQLSKCNCPILGVILNKVDMSKQGHYGHYYGKYGKYYGKYGKENEKTQ